MKILAFGDVHLKHWLIEPICAKFPDHLKVFVGDYFDDFFDTPEKNQSTARWLKESLRQPDRVHLMGNHDFHYWQNGKEKFVCSAFTWDKFYAINEILTSEDWKLLKFFYSKNGWWFTHAGITEHWFAHPILGINEEHVEKTITKSLIDLEMGAFPGPLWAADAYRNGGHPMGGLLWADWRKLSLIEGVKQVVGHTQREKIKIKSADKIQAKAVNIDCIQQEILEIDENGNLKILPVSNVFSV